MQQHSELTTPGERIKYIRDKLLRLSRAELHKRYGISVDTLAAWENGKTNITEKSIERCIKIFNAENLIVSREWLLLGEGLAPNFSFDLHRYFQTQSTEQPSQDINDSLLLAKEIDFFRSLSSNAVTALIPNDDMLPLYARGDHVGGRFRYADEIDSCIGKDCIIKVDDATYVRRIAKNLKTGNYNLVCLNPEWDGNPEPVIFDVKIESAAPIIWHRRLDD